MKFTIATVVLAAATPLAMAMTDYDSADRCFNEEECDASELTCVATCLKISETEAKGILTCQSDCIKNADPKATDEIAYGRCMEGCFTPYLSDKFPSPSAAETDTVADSKITATSLESSATKASATSLASSATKTSSASPKGTASSSAIEGATDSSDETSSAFRVAPLAAFGVTLGAWATSLMLL
ncbi:hypothetical protein IWQ60_007962 [Tieghemiomyces parasiticus]|uniref:Uncharacterized protein n=1 Tax=Tieghemiomyces parasiticus TaxID=78921 RepID=A0A9W8DST3_9FUNG|nr:hypothetical protein IWQ60_007962 [Tieghemiomyces parasiticus]